MDSLMNTLGHVFELINEKKNLPVKERIQFLKRYCEEEDSHLFVVCAIAKSLMIDEKFPFEVSEILRKWNEKRDI